MHVDLTETIAYGQYVIFQRKDYKKLYLLSEKTTCLFMGKDKIDLDVTIGEKLGSTFKMVPKVGINRHFSLQLCDKTSAISSSKETFKELGSGLDNRTICDDGSSQTLTSGNIEVLRDQGTAPKAIIEQLVENSKTFQIKTEFSQEKYLKKKEKKYFEFITIIRPTIRLIAEIIYNRELPKSIGIRIDTLSQILTALNMQPDGNYLLVENGFNGVVAATLLNSLSTGGRLVHVTPGNQNQKQAVLAMNFTSDQMSRLITVRFSTLLELMDQSLPNRNTSKDSLKASGIIDSNMLYLPQNSDVESRLLNINTENNSTQKNNPSENDGKHISTSILSISELRKRKNSNSDSANVETVCKKPRWAFEAELALELIFNKVDGLVVACKEYPANILNKLLTYVLPSRPFVIYSLYQEPLVSLYVQLKQRHDIVFLKITETWLRPYQVLPERTHPAVTVCSSSGFLLSGIKVVQ